MGNREGDRPTDPNNEEKDFLVPRRRTLATRGAKERPPNRLPRERFFPAEAKKKEHAVPNHYRVPPVRDAKRLQHGLVQGGSPGEEALGECDDSKEGIGRSGRVRPVQRVRLRHPREREGPRAHRDLDRHSLRDLREDRASLRLAWKNSIDTGA